VQYVILTASGLKYCSPNSKLESCEVKRNVLIVHCKHLLC